MNPYLILGPLGGRRDLSLKVPFKARLWPCNAAFPDPGIPLLRPLRHLITKRVQSLCVKYLSVASVNKGKTTNRLVRLYSATWISDNLVVQTKFNDTARDPAPCLIYTNATQLQ